MNLIGHRGQDQSAGLIRSDYINHILHGTDVLRKIAKMPKRQPLCFIIYVMTINLVNHKNFGGWLISEIFICRDAKETTQKIVFFIKSWFKNIRGKLFSVLIEQWTSV